VNPVHEARRLLDDAARRESTEEIGRLAPGLLEADHVDAAPSEPVKPSLSPPPERGRSAHLATRVTAVAEVARRGGINVVAPFESTSAHGAVARSLAAELSSHGTSVSTTSYQADGRRGPVAWTHRDTGDHPFDTTLLVLSCDDLANYVLDHGAASFEGRYMIGLWLWDLEMPSEVMRTAARMVHEIWVPTLFTAEAVARATDRRITRTLLPIRGRGPHPRTAGDSPFTFVAQVDYEGGFERQNPLAVVQAFCAAFDPGEGPRLVIETSNGPRYPAEHAELVEAAAGRDDVSVLSEGKAPAGGSAKGSCHVSLHRSEGTGLALAQAMADGMPTIVTGHSFSAEMQDHRDSMQIPFALVPIPSNEYRSEPGGSWAEPDIDAAAAAMRAVIEEPTLAVAKARRARERARRQFSPSRSLRALHERLAAVDHMRYGDVAPRRARPGQRAAVAGRR
jgi:glycosyltransferase involved in cell wall biosynthesis